MRGERRRCSGHLLLPRPLLATPRRRLEAPVPSLSLAVLPLVLWLSRTQPPSAVVAAAEHNRGHRLSLASPCCPEAPPRRHGAPRRSTRPRDARSDSIIFIFAVGRRRSPLPPRLRRPVAALAASCGGLKTLNLSGDAVGAAKSAGGGGGGQGFAALDGWMVGVARGSVQWRGLA